MRLDHETAVVNSALWAAAGDALGWMTELGREGTVVARTGKSRVVETVPWRRRIGGRGGVDVTLPAGTYSDDTQLRLAVSRSIRSSGDFDAESFARIELTVWPSYALGAGRGSKAAAANLTKRGVNWYSNFFATKDQNYLRAGGNGAAMRVQPHVWSNPADTSRIILSVMRDSLSTHGHTHGFCGAVFHALCLSRTLGERKIPGIAAWNDFLCSLHSLPEILRKDGQLATFWLPTWSKASAQPLEQAIAEFVDDARTDLEAIQPLLDQGGRSYPEILQKLGCFEERYRGSGWKTALASVALAWLFRAEKPELALQMAANALGSDTDTIATMAGALMGVVADEPPNWALQDKDYLIRDARRLASMVAGRTSSQFGYPDLSEWRAPPSQSDAVFAYQDALAMSGFGIAEPMSDPNAAGDFVWQWLRLPFGQTILAKRRAGVLSEIGAGQLPMSSRAAKVIPMRSNPELPLPPATRTSHSAGNGNGGRQGSPLSIGMSKTADRLDLWTDQVIQSDFDDRVLGQLLNRYIDEKGSIEAAASFAAIVAKAKLSRQRREMRR